MTAQPFDPLLLPLNHSCVIEASAGTGKTYTLAALYLRLLLGLVDDQQPTTALSVAQILVVTFTEAATQELRERIRRNIYQLRQACRQGYSEEPLFSALLAQITDKQQAIQQLLAAEQAMDEAAIYTIHGFCQRMLMTYTFEVKQHFSQQLLDDMTPLLQQASEDFWRSFCYPQPLAIFQQIQQIWTSPADLRQTLQPYLADENLQIQPTAGQLTFAQFYAQQLALIEQLKQQWLHHADQLPDWFAQSAVDKRSYSARNLPIWLQKVADWAKQSTQTLDYPAELARFQQTTLQSKIAANKRANAVVDQPLFSVIDDFYQQHCRLEQWLIPYAVNYLRHHLRQQKNRQAVIGFDDLLSQLEQALQQDRQQRLAKQITEHYPIALIDEFQDTDPLQYSIFKRLYLSEQAQQAQHYLLVIGDPKQAIYAFRGADIFTYLQAGQQITQHYTLTTNYRSSPTMVTAVNQLFSQQPQPFIFSGIPYLPVNAAARNQQKAFIYQQQSQSALTVYWQQPADQAQRLNVSDYQQLMAQQCAWQVHQWLLASQTGQAYFIDEQDQQSLRAEDIAILVRNRHEAELVRQALQQRQIAAVYLSNRDSVFASQEAYQLALLLQAILAPTERHYLATALACSLFNATSEQLWAWQQDELRWEALIEQFSRYQQLWQQRGVLPMLRRLMQDHQLAENILANPQGERRITNFLHLAELLQTASLQLENEYALLRWLEQQINQPDGSAVAESHQLRLESEQHLVKIITIHKAKGLEYPIVYAPFVQHYRASKQSLYHHNGQRIWQLTADETAKQQAECERLAEDIRLLYVAVTRAIYHCCLGMAPLRPTHDHSQPWQMSAVEYLLLGNQAEPTSSLLASLQQLCQQAAIFNLQVIDQQLLSADNITPLITSSTTTRLQAKQVDRHLDDGWRLTSYSALSRQTRQVSAPVVAADNDHDELAQWLPSHASEVIGETAAAPLSTSTALSPLTFPRGPSAGTFLHGLLEQMDFSQAIDSNWLANQLVAAGFAVEWLPIVQQWLIAICQMPLDGQTLQLANLALTEQVREMAFTLPLQQLIDAKQLLALSAQYDSLTAQKAQQVDFAAVQGMLTGFIDLVFHWQGRYYLLDYKSNWLGDQPQDYQSAALQQAMSEHHYDLQYQLYSVALHRYLQQRLVDYQYQRDFGGVYYLFLRGMPLGEGIFFSCPAWPLIEQLDQLLAKP